MEPKAYSYIRFSNPSQEKGDSERRQVEKAEQYAKEKGLTLDQSLTVDRGLSAFKGAHRIKGALGEFLQNVNEGKIPKGSVLIVEDFDRFSRENWMVAIPQFLQLMLAGIKVVTLQGGQELDLQSGWGSITKSFSEMEIAHRESEKKSKRLSAAWEQKLKNINEKKLTKKAPKWLRPKTDNKGVELGSLEFELIPDAQQTLLRIFEMKADGVGELKIARELNGDSTAWKPPKWKRNEQGGWSKSYITKILRSRAVLGEFQPHKFINKVREPIGDPIPDYFPPMIDKDLFDSVQSKIAENSLLNNRGGGHTGAHRNIFKNLLVCYVCGGSMTYKGDVVSAKSKGPILRCSNSQKNNGCNVKGINYEEFETIIFKEVEELDISKILPQQSEIEKELDSFQKKLDSFQHQVKEFIRKIDNTEDAISDADDKLVRDGLNNKLKKLYSDKESKNDEIEGLKRKCNRLENQRRNQQQNIDNVKEIRQVFNQSKDEQQLIELRMKLNTELKRLIRVIKVKPLMEPYKRAQILEEGYPQVAMFMHSKYIDKIKIYFNTDVSNTTKRLLFLKSTGEEI